MRNEIGSEFWHIPTCAEENAVFNKNTKWFISGTSALEYILSYIEISKKIRTAAIPSWCCSCMITPFLKKNISIQFYDVFINENKNLVCDFSSVSECDVTLSISYFGYTSQIKIGEPYGIIIRDITHSVFAKQYKDADYYFGSLRKWAGFWTGGFAWCRDGWIFELPISSLDCDYEYLRRSAMENKKKYLSGEINSKSYLSVFETCENYLDTCPVSCGSMRDIAKAKKFDVSTIKNKRRENAQFLLTAFYDLAVFSTIKDEDCPLFVPILLSTEKRDKLKRYFIDNQIYCPIHWAATEFHCLNKKTAQLYNEELSIVCDQRYNLKDMQRIVDLFNDFNEQSKVN